MKSNSSKNKKNIFLSLNKYLIFSIIFLKSLFSFCQCPAPTNFTIQVDVNNAFFYWTENGNSTSWQIAIVNDLYNNSQIITRFIDLAENNPATVLNFSFSPVCTVFFVRSVCGPQQYSDWSTPLSDGDCDPPTFNYYTSQFSNQLSNETSSNNWNKKNIVTSPNPILNTFKINTTSTNIEVYTIYGQLVKQFTGNFDENYDFNIQDLTKGIYLLKIFNKKNEKNIKLIKQ